MKLKEMEAPSDGLLNNIISGSVLILKVLLGRKFSIFFSVFSHVNFTFGP